MKTCGNIVNGGDWLWSPANIKGANKDAKIYVRRSTTLHNLLFCVHTLCMNYVTSTFLLVSSSVRSKQLLCFVQGQGQKREQKHTTKNFVGFHNHSLYWLWWEQGNIEQFWKGTRTPLYKNSKQTNSSLFNIFVFKNCKSKNRYTKSGGHSIPSSVLGRHDFWIRPYQIWIPKFIRWLKNIYEDYPKAWRSWIT